jgi:SAM-dependent methyltransferase
MTNILYAATIFLGAFLLFLVQPIIAKQILPWFGGSSAVWTTCMVFFQCALLLGYAYAHWTTRWLAPRVQAVSHALLLLVSLLVLPIIPGAAWKPVGDAAPIPLILGLLTMTIGLPYLLLAATGPLVQTWFARAHPSGTVYRLFALSNLASLSALLAYPPLIEPSLSARQQTFVWSGLYLVFVLSCAAAALQSLRASPGTVAAVMSAEKDASSEDVPSVGRRLLWLLLSALGSAMLLAVTNHITQNIASVPFLWILPLTLYLVTFILCFEGRGWYNRALVLVPLAFALVAMAWGLSAGGGNMHVKLAVPLYCAGLFLCCMFYHGELSRLKPSPRYLTGFYLMLSLGGAVGGLLVGVVAPLTLDAFYELGIGIVLTAAIAALLFRGLSRWVSAAAVVITIAAGAFFFKYVDTTVSDARLLSRSFYGALKIKDSPAEEGRDALRRLRHGMITHGSQFLSAEKRLEPTSYYGRFSGVGIAIRYHRPSPVRVAVVGLGAGTVAAFAGAGDVVRFYEIDPEVVRIAENEFTYLADARSRAAKVESVLGDARLNLEREPSGGFDVIVVDAFSGDSIPVHLMTREALAVYARHLKPGGIVAFHVTNRYLNLAPVVERIAAASGATASLIMHTPSEHGLEPTDWVLVSGNPTFNSLISKVATPITVPDGLRPWTDDFNNLLQVLR